MKNSKLSIVILNYNTSELLEGCLASLDKVKNEVTFEVVVVDNGSTDNSLETLQKKFKEVEVVETGENLGFARGNNQAKTKISGNYVLFLNTDTLISKGVLKKSLDYFKKHDLGALTCKHISICFV